MDFRNSIVINRKGLLVGGLVDEEEQLGGLWKYKLAKLVIGLFFLILITFLVFGSLNYILSDVFGVSRDQIIQHYRVYWLPAIIVSVVVVIVAYLWRRKL
ncbi:hypothetical protein ACFL0Z_01640 [Patescibacteria group bacterium]